MVSVRGKEVPRFSLHGTAGRRVVEAAGRRVVEVAAHRADGAALGRLGWCARAGGYLTFVVGLVPLRGPFGIRLKFGPRETTTIFHFKKSQRCNFNL